MVQKYSKAQSWEKNTELEKIRKEGAFFRYPLTPGGNELSDWSILFTSQLQDFLDNAPGSSVVAQYTWSLRTLQICFLAGAGTVERTISWAAMPTSRHLLLPEAAPALPVRRLWRNVCFLALTEAPFQPLYRSGLPIYVHVHESAVWACGCLSLSSGKAGNRKAKQMFSLFSWEGLLTVF